MKTITGLWDKTSLKLARFFWNKLCRKRKFKLSVNEVRSIPMFIKRKRKSSDSVLWQKPLTPQKLQLHNDCGPNKDGQLGVTTATKLVWLELPFNLRAIYFPYKVLLRTKFPQKIWNPNLTVQIWITWNNKCVKGSNWFSNLYYSERCKTERLKYGKYLKNVIRYSRISNHPIYLNSIFVWYRFIRIWIKN